MTAYEIRFLPSVRKDIRKMPRAMLRRLQEALHGLSANPHPPGAKKIQGYDGYFRLRVGDYRVVYSVAEEVRIIEIIRIGHRRDVYRNL